MEQLNLFGNASLSALLAELQREHRFCYHLREKDECPAYQVIRSDKGKYIQLCVFMRKKDGAERIIAKSVYLGRTDRGTYTICHFDAKCLPHLIDCAAKNLLLECFVNQTEIIDDLEEKHNLPF